jgi:hypothetical protein
MDSVNIRRYFFGIDYPADREDLVRILRQAGASDDDVRIVRELPPRNYSGVFDVSGAIGQVHSSTTV